MRQLPLSGFPRWLLSIADKRNTKGVSERVRPYTGMVIRYHSGPLRAVAFKRAQERGGRPSVSALLVELAERHRDELTAEAGPFFG